MAFSEPYFQITGRDRALFFFVRNPIEYDNAFLVYTFR